MRKLLPLLLLLLVATPTLAGDMCWKGRCQTSIFGFLHGVSQSTDRFVGIIDRAFFDAEASVDAWQPPVRGRLSNLRANVNTDPNNGNGDETWTVTIRTCTTATPTTCSASAVTCQIVAGSTTCSDTIHFVTVEEGQRVTMFWDANGVPDGTDGYSSTLAFTTLP